jgi:hypothetical protein
MDRAWAAAQEGHPGQGAVAVDLDEGGDGVVVGSVPAADAQDVDLPFPEGLGHLVDLVDRAGFLQAAWIAQHEGQLLADLATERTFLACVAVQDDPDTWHQPPP